MASLDFSINLPQTGQQIFTPQVIGLMLVVSSIAGYIVFFISRKAGKKKSSKIVR
ncbi:MAG: LPXTG cell wall anchor domain-containing protein [Candidatus Dojkabacteria bacterium]|nr:LPXTG cell wall anchor domain-containing protein [Candidatus Dojkabacteria bacterium]